jgi:hypothetical protein
VFEDIESRRLAVAMPMIDPEDDFELDVLLAEMIGDGLIVVTPDRRLEATEKGDARLLLSDTYSVQRAIPRAVVLGWSDLSS